MRTRPLNEYGKTIRGFPGYEITNYGRVFNLRTDREMVLSPTQYGYLTVGLFKDGYQHRRSVKGLVARAFVEGETELFNTPILLDGDNSNLHAENIVWRPRWFAHQYSKQFKQVYNWYFYGPIVELESGEQYTNHIEAAVINGILCREIKQSIYNQIYYVFPTKQRFAYLT